MDAPYFINTFQHPHWLTNTYCIHDRATARVLVVDAGAAPDFFEVSPEQVQGILLTHDHPDHLDKLSAWQNTTVYAHDAARLPNARNLKQMPFRVGSELTLGSFKVRTIHTPGHSPDHLCFAVCVADQLPWLLFSGDLLFRESVGGTRNGSVCELRKSIELLLETFPPETLLFPGHGSASSLGHEQRHNPFLRAWQSGTYALEGLDYQGQQVECLVRARDYDGDWKLLIRDASGCEHLVAA